MRTEGGEKVRREERDVNVENEKEMKRKEGRREGERGGNHENEILHFTNR